MMNSKTATREKPLAAMSLSDHAPYVAALARLADLDAAVSQAEADTQARVLEVQTASDRVLLRGIGRVDADATVLARRAEVHTAQARLEQLTAARNEHRQVVLQTRSAAEAQLGERARKDYIAAVQRTARGLMEMREGMHDMATIMHTLQGMLQAAHSGEDGTVSATSYLVPMPYSPHGPQWVLPAVETFLTNAREAGYL